MTFELARLILQRHFVECRPSPAPDSIEALSEFTHRDQPGLLFTEWVTLPLERQALFDWLGY